MTHRRQKEEEYRGCLAKRVDTTKHHVLILSSSQTGWLTNWTKLVNWNPCRKRNTMSRFFCHRKTNKKKLIHSLVSRKEIRVSKEDIWSILWEEQRQSMSCWSRLCLVYCKTQVLWTIGLFNCRGSCIFLARHSVLSLELSSSIDWKSDWKSNWKIVKRLLLFSCSGQWSFCLVSCTKRIYTRDFDFVLRSWQREQTSIISFSHYSCLHHLLTLRLHILWYILYTFSTLSAFPFILCFSLVFLLNINSFHGRLQ